MGIKFHKDPLAANVYIVYHSSTWPKIPPKNFTLKNCLFGATNIVKYGDKDKWVYRGYGIAFDGGDWWRFGNSTNKNIITFGVDSSSSSHADNHKITFNIRVKVQLLKLMETLVHQRKK